MLTKLLDLAEQQARVVMTVLHQDLVPSWVIISGDDKPVIRATPWRNDNEKRLAELYMRHELKAHKAKAYSFVTEAWTAVAPEDWDPETPLPHHERASERVDRKEVVLAFATDGKTTKWRQWNIQRDWKGEVCALERQKDFSEDEFSSWMNELLK